MSEKNGVKFLEADRLIELLQQLPQNYKIAPNNVKNLAIFDEEDNYYGFIDFLMDGEIETCAEDQEDDRA